MQELPVRVNLPNSPGDLVVFLGVIAVVHHSCYVAGFEGGKLCVDFRNGVLRQNPPWGGDSLFFCNGFFQPFKASKGTNCFALRDGGMGTLGTVMPE